MFCGLIPNDFTHGPLTRYVKFRTAHAPGMPGTFSPSQNEMKPLVSDPGIHHGTCVTHVSWCMPGSLTRGGGENVPGTPGAYATRNFTYLIKGPYTAPQGRYECNLRIGIHSLEFHHNQTLKKKNSKLWVCKTWIDYKRIIYPKQNKINDNRTPLVWYILYGPVINRLCTSIWYTWHRHMSHGICWYSGHASMAISIKWLPLGLVISLNIVV